MSTILFGFCLVLAGISIYLYLENRKLRKDPLTGLANRHLISGRRKPHSTCAVIVIDLNDFKTVNDIKGHQAGDAQLIYVACRLKEVVLRQGDAFRVGGDEFEIILHDTDLIGAATVARKIEIKCAPVPLAIGIAVQRDPKVSLDELRRIADAAMFADKRAKKLE